MNPKRPLSELQKLIEEAYGEGYVLDAFVEDEEEEGKFISVVLADPQGNEILLLEDEDAYPMLEAMLKCKNKLNKERAKNDPNLN